MKKSGLVFVLILILLVPVIHAGFLDWLKGALTGRATTATSAANVTVGNTAPTVYNVAGISAQSPTEAGETRVTFESNVTDIDGAGNIASVQTRLTQGGTTRTNTSCVFVTSLNSTTNRYQCTVGLFYFDPNAADWAVNVTAYDSYSSPGAGTNTTTTFTYNSLKAFVIGTSTGTAGLTWPTVTLISTNQTSNNDPLLLNNTGNANISIGGINLTVINLFGETTTDQYIAISNMSAHISTGGSCSGAACTECANNYTIANATSTVVTSATLLKGNFTINDGGTASGQEQLYFCLRGIGSTATAQQSYSTNGAGAWTVTIT